MKKCCECDEPLNGPGVFRIETGGVYWGNVGKTIALRFLHHTFEDGTRLKWLCVKCAHNLGVFIDDLTYDSCQVVDGRERCNKTFEPIEDSDDPFGNASDCVLHVQWGILDFNESSRGAAVQFKPDKSVGGYIHYVCACDAWRLPLLFLERDDMPTCA